ncbi:DUF1287 domain-containing protein [Polaribacter sp. KT25b]|uniref:DUF1287 domain-containing protein n=1 Tax=Polaribacter sp. KT25b TaxID=1855336 RepID=UPI0034A396E3
MYNPRYFSIDYPDGDLLKGKGVCTDIIIRAYRNLDINLQMEVCLNMKINYNLYPKIWRLNSNVKINSKKSK